MQANKVSMERMKPLKIGLLAAVAAVTGVSLVTAAPATAGTGDNQFRVIQHNTDMGGHQSAINEANSWGDVDAVTFQELCESHKDALVAAGWQVHWKPQIDGNAKCPVTADGHTRKGNAIATRRGLGETQTRDLGTYGGRNFKLLCAHITGSGIANSWVCTTHLALGYDGAPDGAANRAAQTAKIADTLNPWVASGRRVVLTGDFNAVPASGELGPIYRVQGNGTDGDQFWEGDQSDASYCASLCRNMQPTTDNGRKLDYFFASHRGVDAHTGLSKGVVPTNPVTSGHYIVRGQVTFGPLN